MPYLKKIEDFSNDDVRQAVLAAANQVIQTGYLPTDLHRRNIMLSQNPTKKKGKSLTVFGSFLRDS
jgi:hypothetical protein